MSQPEQYDPQEEFRSRGYCEDYPCCGHEAGDCFGQKYGTDEEIKQRVYDRWNDPDYDIDDPEPEGWY